MKNISCYFKHSDMPTNFSVHDLKEHKDGTKTAKVWCTHGDWTGNAVFHTDGTVEVKQITTYHYYEVEE